MEEHPFWWSFYFWSGSLSKSPSRQLFQSRIYVEVIHLSSVLSSLAQQWPRAMELLRCMEDRAMEPLRNPGTSRWAKRGSQ